MANGNISSNQIRYNLKNWICGSPLINHTLTNPFAISILILIVIWLLDMLYGKSFENASPREILQHSSTVLFVMIAGIFLNNLAITKCGSISGGGHEDLEELEVPEVPEAEAEIELNEAYDQYKYDGVLSQYE